MDDISVGAVGAAAIAGLVSVLGLVIAKEQKTSEFRQAWIDDLRKCIVSYLVNINAISDAIRLKAADKPFDNELLVSSYKSLNEANHGIRLRVNSDEAPAGALISAMMEFEVIADANATFTPEKIRDVENRFVEAAKTLLKFEWVRVKHGEKTFVWTKWLVTLSILIMLIVLFYMWMNSGNEKKTVGRRMDGGELIQAASIQLNCQSEKPVESSLPRRSR